MIRWLGFANKCPLATKWVKQHWYSNSTIISCKCILKLIHSHKVSHKTQNVFLCKKIVVFSCRTLVHVTKCFAHQQGIFYHTTKSESMWHEICYKIHCCSLEPFHPLIICHLFFTHYHRWEVLALWYFRVDSSRDLSWMKAWHMALVRLEKTITMFLFVFCIFLFLHLK